MAMPAGLARYHAAKRAARSGGSIVVVSSSKPTRRKGKRTHHRKHKRRRSHSGGGGVRALPLALAAGGLAYLVSPAGPSFVRENLAKIPGTKTFGPVATAGLACLAVDRFVKRNKWLRLAGYAGIVVAAVQVGTKGSGFQWLGDEGSGDYDLSDDESGDDMGDDD